MDPELQTSDLTLQEKLAALPSSPGVYQFKSAEGKVIYVGKAQSLRPRVRQYFQKSRTPDPRLDALVGRVRDLEVIVTDSEVEALILEANLIKKLKPRYNVVLKDDKSYPFIVITSEPFPRVFVTRRVIKDGSRYFGPFTDVKTMRFALKTVRDIFMIRSCNFDLTEESIRRKKFRICLDYHIKKCAGPCEGIESQEHYNQMIQQVAEVLRGRTARVADQLKTEMDRLSDSMRFEDAARVRDRLHALQVYREKQKIVDVQETDRDIVAVSKKEDDACGVIFKVREGKLLGSQHYYMKNVEEASEEEVLESLLERHYLDAEDIPPEIVVPRAFDTASLLIEWLRKRASSQVDLTVPRGGELLKLVGMVRTNARFLLDELQLQRMKRGDYVPHAVAALQKDLRLPAPPRRIECFDVSNIQGSDTVASMVVFTDGKARKSEYRRFAIRSVSGPDDFASMHEAVERRYSRLLQEEGAAPDLVVIDGGKGQLSSALEVMRRLNLTSVPIVGLAKRLEEVFIPDQSEPVLLPKASSSLKLLQQIRDEAHRFAVTFHRLRRSKRILQTELDLIKGIGKARARELLEVFGSVQGVKFASEEQLADIVGSKVAAEIKEHFQDGENT